MGSKTATAAAGTAVDNVDNSSDAASCTYSVVYDVAGFFRPVDNLPMLNVAKAGSSIPLKFSLGGNQGLSILQGAPTIRSITCDTSLPTDTIEEYSTTTANNGLTYDALADQYNYVWKTDKAWAGKCFQLTMTLIDGTTHQANFKFTK